VAQADALVFFGATGDLAHKKIFPALQALAKRGNLHIPVIGVAKAGWTLDQLKQRAEDSVESYGGLDAEAFAQLSRCLRYIDGDYSDPTTFQELRRELGDAKHPLHYLAILPTLFETVIHQLGDSVVLMEHASSLRSHSDATSPGSAPSSATRNLSRTSRSTPGRAARHKSGFLINHKRKLTSLPVLRYSSGHRKGRLKILSVKELPDGQLTTLKGR
jgi:Glucose-6-phosphate dehydrogenase, NAD binding domain